MCNNMIWRVICLIFVKCSCFRQKCKEGSGFGNLLKHVDEEVFKRYYEEKYTWRNNQGEMLLHHDKKMMSIEGKYPLIKDY